MRKINLKYHNILFVLLCFMVTSCSQLLDKDSVLIVKAIEKSSATYGKTKYTIQGIETSQGWTTAKGRPDGFIIHVYEPDGKFSVGDTVFLSKY